MCEKSQVNLAMDWLKMSRSQYFSREISIKCISHEFDFDYHYYECECTHESVERFSIYLFFLWRMLPIVWN